MKKISLVLILVFLSGVFGVSAASPINIYIDHTFNNIETGSKPSGMTNAEYGNIALVNKEGFNKYLLMRNRDAYNNISFSISTAEKYIFIETKVKSPDYFSEKSLTINGETAVAFNSGSSKLNAGVSARAKDDQWIEVKLKLNTKSWRYEVYIDNSLVGDRILLNSKGITSVGFRSEETSGVQTTFMVDYLRVYGGVDYAKPSDFQSVPFNFKEKAISMDVDEQPISQTLYSNNIDGVAIGSSPGNMNFDGNVMVKIDDDGNKFVHMDKQTSAQTMIDLLINKNLYKVVFQADIKSETARGSSIFTMRDTSAKFLSPISVSNGNFVVNGKTIKGFNCKNDWVNVALVINFLKREYSVYLNNTLVSENNTYTTLSTNINLTRFQMGAGDYTADLKIDNVEIYTGVEPKEKEQEKEEIAEIRSKTSLKYDPVDLKPKMEAFELIEQDISNNPSPIFDDFNEMLVILEKSVGFVSDNSKIMLNGSKYNIQTIPYIRNGNLFIPLSTLAQAMGLPFEWNAASKVAKIDGIEFKEGSKTIEGKIGEVELKYAIEVVDGVIYAPAKEVADALDIYTYVSSMGLAVFAAYILPIGSGKLDSVMKSAFDFIVYDRPNTDSIIERFNNNPSNAQHPRVRINKDELELLKQRVETDPLYKTWSDNTIAEAEKYPLKEPTFGFDSAGIRLQGGISERNVLNLFWAWYMTGEDIYYEKAKIATIAQANLIDWNPRHFLDTAAKTLSMATMYDCFYDMMDDETRDIIGTAIVEKGLKPAYESYYGKGISGFPKNTNNWNVICNGGIIIGALAVMDDYETSMCADIIEKGLKSSENMMGQFAPNGSWFEGPSYWHYLIQNMVPFFDAVIRVFNDDFGLMSVPGMKETGYFLPSISGNTGAFAYHDTTIYYRGNVMELFWFAKYNRDPYLARLRLNEMSKYGYKGTILDMLYYDSSCVADSVEIPLDNYYGGTEVATSRSGWDSNAAFMAIHAGYNEVAHGQLDMGTFEYEVFGKRFASDNGADDYNLLGYFDTNNGTRYSYYVNRAEGHNLYVINPDSGGGQERYVGSEIVVGEQKEDGAIYTVDLSPAYGGDVLSARRGYKLDQDRMVFTVQDEIMPASSGDEYYWFWNCQQDIKIIDDKTVMLGEGAATVALHIEANVDYDVSVMPSLPLSTSPARPTQMTNLTPNMNKICIRFSSGSEQIKLRVTAVPAGKVYMNEPLDDISTWKIGEKQVFEKPAVLSSIMLDGKPLDGFTADNDFYTLKTSLIPEVTATADYSISVSQATRENPYASIIVQDKENLRNAKLYIINFDLSISFDDEKPSSQKYNFAEIVASAVPEPANVPQNINDGDLNTRWAAQGKQHLIIDLGEMKKVSALGLSIMSGNQRIQELGIYYSADGEVFEFIAPARSRGITNEIEYTRFGSVNARWIKVVFNGNSQNSWNSITELEIYE